MTRKAAFALSLLTCAPAFATPITFEGVRAAARKGDYQAQRNLAYGYAAYPYKGQVQNPMLACAWYIVVLQSGDEQVGPGDVGNVKIYCGRLDQLSLDAATAQARTFYRKIYKREPRF